MVFGAGRISQAAEPRGQAFWFYKFSEPAHVPSRGCVVFLVGPPHALSRSRDLLFLSHYCACLLIPSVTTRRQPIRSAYWIDTNTERTEDTLHTQHLGTLSGIWRTQKPKIEIPENF